MTTSINGKVIGAVDLDPVDVSLDSIREEVLAAIANAGVPGEIKLVQNATGIAPAGTTKIESIVPDPTYNWLAAGEFRQATLPKAFIVADAPNTKYVQLVNANEDFITMSSDTTSTSVKRFLASSSYVPTALTLQGAGGIGYQACACLTDTGHLVYANTAQPITSFYAVAPASLTSVIKSTASFTGFGSNRGYVHMVNTGSTVVMFNGAINASVSVYSQFNPAGAWEFNPSTNTATTLPPPPFQSLASMNYGGIYTCVLNNEVFISMHSIYSEDGATIQSAQVDAIPLYKLSADRVWTKIGNMPSPYIVNTAGVQTKQAYARVIAAGGYIWLMPTPGSWPTCVSMGLIRVNPNTGATTTVELVLTNAIVSPSLAFPTSYPSVAFRQAITTADGKKVYGATSSSSPIILALENVVNAQPVTTFYVKKT